MCAFIRMYTHICLHVYLNIHNYIWNFGPGSHREGWGQPSLRVPLPYPKLKMVWKYGPGSHKEGWVSTLPMSPISKVEHNFKMLPMTFHSQDPLSHREGLGSSLPMASWDLGPDQGFKIEQIRKASYPEPGPIKS